MKTKESVALAAAFAAQVIFGFSFMFTKIALDVAQPLFLIAVRFLVAFLVMNILVGVYGVNRCVAAQQEADAKKSEAVAVEN